MPSRPSVPGASSHCALHTPTRTSVNIKRNFVLDLIWVAHSDAAVCVRKCPLSTHKLITIVAERGICIHVEPFSLSLKKNQSISAQIIAAVSCIFLNSRVKSVRRAAGCWKLGKVCSGVRDSSRGAWGLGPGAWGMGHGACRCSAAESARRGAASPSERPI